MFEAPSAEDRLARVRSSDPTVAGAGGRVLWIPKSRIDTGGLLVAGPVYFYHRTPRILFGVRIAFSGAEHFPPTVPIDLLRTNVHTTTVESNRLYFQCRRSVLPSDALVVEVVIRNDGDTAASITVEAVVDAVSSDEAGRLRSMCVADGRLEIDSCLEIDGHPAVDVECVAAISRSPDISSVGRSNGTDDDSILDSVGDDARFNPQCTVLDETVVTEQGLNAQRGLLVQSLTIPPGMQYVTRAVLALTESMNRSRLSARTAAASNSVAQSTNYWISYLGSCPELSSSNQLVEKRFARAWIDARLSSSRPIRGANPYREVFAGTREKRFADAHAVVSRIRSDRWNQSSSFGKSPLLNFLHYQREDGALPTRIEFGRIPSFGSEGPDWSVFWLHFLIDPDRRQLRRVYHALAEYARFVSRVSDPTNTWLFDAELLVSRDDTIFVPGSTPSRIKGIQSTVNQYRLRQALASAAAILGFSFDAQDWAEQATQIRISVRNRMWNPETKTFCALDKESDVFVRTGADESLLPYATDLIEAAHLNGLRLLADATARPTLGGGGDAEHPVIDGSNGSASGVDGVKLGLIEALATAGDKYGDDEMIDLAARRFLRMLRGSDRDGIVDPSRGDRRFYLDRSADAVRPISTSEVVMDTVASILNVSPSRDDAESGYAAIVDQILRFICGVRPHLHGITIRPLPFLVDYFEIDKVVVRNNHLGVWRRGELFGVRLDGEDIATAQIGESIELDIPLLVAEEVS